MWRTLSELHVKLCGICVSKCISKRIPTPIRLRQEKLSHTSAETSTGLSAAPELQI